MEKFRKLILANLVIGWIHLITFTLCVVAAFGAIIYQIYIIIDSNGQLQNLVLVLVAGFFSLTVFGSLAYASHEFIRGLQTRDHARMLMFRICIIVLFLLSCGYGVYISIHVYNRSIELSDDYITHRLVGSFIILTFEFVVWVLVYIIYHKLRFEAKQRRLEKLNRRKLNTVAQQLTILQPAYFPDHLDENGKIVIENDGNKEEDCEKAAEEQLFEKIDKADVNKKPKTSEKFKDTMDFIENEKAVTEKAFEKIRIEPKIPKMEAEKSEENFPPPPQGF